MTNPDANHPFHSGDLININSDGTHTIVAEIKLSTGRSTFVSSTFSVDNDREGFANGSKGNSAGENLYTDKT